MATNENYEYLVANHWEKVKLMESSGSYGNPQKGEPGVSFSRPSIGETSYALRLSPISLLVHCGNTSGWFIAEGEIA